jgi:hypothetical protein
LTAGRALLLLAAFVGLFAMHGLSDHGTAHLSAHASPEHMTLSASVAAVMDPGSQDSPLRGSGMVGLCMAVLGLAGMAIALVARANRRSAASPQVLTGA